MKFSVNQSDYFVEENDGLFINSSFLHSARPYQSTDSEYICLDIDPVMLSGFPESILPKKYVAPFVESKFHSAITLQNSIPWQHRILDSIHSIFEAHSGKNYGFELDIYSSIWSIWHLMIINTQNVKDNAVDHTYADIDDQRIKNILTHIHNNFKQKITLGDLAISASVCRSECCRLFKRMIKSTPIEYLIAYRINKSLFLLRETDLPIIEIASEVGFGSVSYYIEKFRKQTNFTPKEFRDYCTNISEQASRR